MSKDLVKRMSLKCMREEKIDKQGLAKVARVGIDSMRGGVGIRKKGELFII